MFTAEVLKTGSSRACDDSASTRPHNIAALRFLLWQKSPHFRGLSVTTKSPPRQASQAGSCHHACLHRCHRAHTRTWHGTASCSNIIGTLPREPMAASGQVYPKLQRNLLDV